MTRHYHLIVIPTTFTASCQVRNVASFMRALNALITQAVSLLTTARGQIAK